MHNFQLKKTVHKKMCLSEVRKNIKIEQWKTVIMSDESKIYVHGDNEMDFVWRRLCRSENIISTNYKNCKACTGLYKLTVQSDKFIRLMVQ